MAIKELASNGHLPVAGKVGIVVDAYLGDIPEINARNQAIIENLALPKNFTLIYASSDVGLEYGANTLIKYADQASRQVLDYIAKGRGKSVESTLSEHLFKGYRVVLGKETLSP